MENIKSAYDVVLEMFLKLDKVYTVELCFSYYINELNALKKYLNRLDESLKDLSNINDYEIKNMYSIIFNVDFEKVETIKKRHLTIINRIFKDKDQDEIEFLKGYILV